MKSVYKTCLIFIFAFTGVLTLSVDAAEPTEPVNKVINDPHSQNQKVEQPMPSPSGSGFGIQSMSVASSPSPRAPQSGSQGGGVDLTLGAVGDIDFSSGKVMLTRTDLDIPGLQNLNLQISRSYNSHKFTLRPNGSFLPQSTQPWGPLITKAESSPARDMGSGITVVDTDGNGKKDLVHMRSEDGARGVYSIGYDLKPDGTPTRWGPKIAFPLHNLAYSEGAGVEHADIDGNGVPDLIFVVIHDFSGHNTAHYTIAMNIQPSGHPERWITNAKFATPFSIDKDSDGAGITVADVDQNGKPELIIGYLNDHPKLVDQTAYAIAWNINNEGLAERWTRHVVRLSTRFAFGMGVTSGDLDGNNQPELILLYMYLHNNGEGSIRYRIGWNMNALGDVNGWSEEKSIPGELGYGPRWHRDHKQQSVAGARSGGIGASLVDLDGDGSYELYTHLSDIVHGVQRFRKGSLEYVTQPDQRWSGWLGGHGWSSNLDKRAFCLRGPNGKLQVTLEGFRGALNYTYENDTWRSTIKGDTTQIEVIKSGSEIKGIKVVSGTGIAEYYEAKFYQELNHQLLGFYLSKTVDLLGNTITSHYETYQPSAKFRFGFYRTRFKDRYEQWFQPPSNAYSAPAVRYYLRPSRITDAFGRDITIHYGDAHNLYTGNREEMITRIQYRNQNGDPISLRYHYDKAGALTKASHEDLPSETYSYSHYEPQHFTQLAMVHNGKRSSVELIYYFHQLNGVKYEPQLYRKGFRTLSESRIAQLTGPILTTVTSPRGSQIKYEYQDSLHAEHTQMNLAGSFPTVQSKTIVEDPQNRALDQRYQFSYRQHDGHPLRHKYTPQDIHDTSPAYMFPWVKITPPEHLLGVTLWYENGKLSKTVQDSYNGAQYTTLQEWDFSTGLLKSATTKLNNTVISHRKITAYDDYTNPLSTITTTGTGADQVVVETKTIYTYPSVSAHRSKGLFHFPKIVESTTTSKGKKTTSKVSHVYSPEGLVREKTAIHNDVITERHSYTHDSKGRVLSLTNHLLPNRAARTTYTYQYVPDQQYTITKTINDTFSSKSVFDPYLGNLIQSVDGNGRVTTMRQVDRLGLHTQTTHPDGTSETLVRSKDMMSETVTALGLSTTLLYDKMGRLVETRKPNGIPDEKISYYFGDKLKHTYVKKDSFWKLEQTNHYDKRLRITRSDSPDWGSGTTVYSDGLTPSVVATDPNGVRVSTYYNVLGEAIRQETYAPQKNTSKGAPADRHTSKTTHYTYDHAGNLIKLVGQKLTYQWEYDDRGRLITTYLPYSNSGSASKKPYSRHTYYVDGSPKVTTIFNDTGTAVKTVTTLYDTHNRAIGSTVKDLITNKSSTTSSVYDTSAGHLGQIKTIHSPDTSTTFTYDKLGRVVRENKTIKVEDRSYSTQVSTTYDDKGRLAMFTYPDGKVLRYSYDSLNRLSGIQYDGSPVITYRYDGDNLLEAYTYGNALTTSFSYLKDVLVERSVVKNANNSVYYDHSMTYDADTNMTQESYTDLFSYDPSHKRTLKYYYNNWNELIQIDDGSRKGYQKFAYDRAQNRTTFINPREPDVKEANYVMDPNSHRLLKRRHGKGVAVYEYDAQGNMVTHKVHNPAFPESGSPALLMEYGYSHAGQLESVDVTDHRGVSSRRASYVYDHGRQRVYGEEVRGNGAIEKTIYVWDFAGRIIGEMSEDGEMRTKYIYHGNSKIAMIKSSHSDRNIPDHRKQERSENLYYFHNDTLGSTRFITDQSGIVQQQVQMDPYGNVERFTGKWPEEIHYTGKKVDHLTGFYYFNHRYYDPDLGRFISEDPAEQFLNPYVYGANQPLRYVDPDGRILLDIAVGAAIGATLGGFYAGTQAMINGEDFNGILSKYYEGAYKGAIAGAIIGAMYGMYAAGVEMNVAFEYGGYQLNLTQALAAAGVTGTGAAASGQGDEQPGRDERLLEDDYSFSSELELGYQDTRVNPFNAVAWPSGHKDRVVTSRFGETRIYGPHNGVDIRAYKGDHIFAAQSGFVHSAQYNGRRGEIIIYNLDGSISGYAHIKPEVSVGTLVFAGRFIGVSDGSGTRHPHLHYTFRPSVAFKKADPLQTQFNNKSIEYDFGD